MSKSRCVIVAVVLVTALWLALSALAPALADEPPAKDSSGGSASGPEAQHVTQAAQEEPARPQLVTEATAAPALGNFQDINLPGFGNTDNRYSWSMVVFKGKIYVGTWNLSTSLGLFQLILGFLNPWFLNGVSSGTEVWRYDGGPLGRTWTRVVSGGLGDADNIGLRNMTVWDDPDDDPDRGPAIYGTTINVRDGLEVWRSFDGNNWEVVVGRGARIGNGFGHGPANESGRAMLAVGDHLYVGAMRAQGGQKRRRPFSPRWWTANPGTRRDTPNW